MRASELAPAPHIAAEDLDGDTVVTITGVRFAEVGEDKTRKGVIDTKEFDRGFVVNRTNLLRIIAQHGHETEDWVGQQITLYPSETDFAGRTVPCVRVREK